jgi:hypothetical protein
MARTFTSYVHYKDRAFKPGDEVPADLESIVGEHVTQGVTTGTPDQKVEASEEELESYDQLTKEELRAEADGRQLDVKASATKAELVEALEADDAAHAESE